MVSTPSEVDEVYYSPISTESQEMENTAAAMKYGMGGGSASQQITLTRWLSAKVQDFPEVRLVTTNLCYLIFQSSKQHSLFVIITSKAT